MTHRHWITPESIASRPVFAVDGRTFAWGDVEVAARLDDSWRELEEITRRGLAYQKRLAMSSEHLAADVIAEAAKRFRYANGLLAGDELVGWLERWDITTLEWREYVVRMLLRERWVGEFADTSTRFSVSEDEVAGALWVEAVCSGFLERAAERLAGDAALAAAAGERFDMNWEPAKLLARIRPAVARARRDAVTEEAIAREVTRHRLEWMHIEGELLSLPVEDAAREAALCIRADGRSLAEVGAACGGEPTRLSTFVADADAALSPTLVAALEGELIGPIPSDGAFVLLLLERKTPPSTADANVRQRAVERIVARAVQRAVNDAVEWHEYR
jgi:hypothetical protein